MTRVGLDDTVVYEVALCSHPTTTKQSEDEVPDDVLIERANEAIETDDEIDWPDWMVIVSDAPDMPPIRYVTTSSRINVRAPYGTDAFETINEHVDFDFEPHMSHWSPEHEDDFDGPIHLDVAQDQNN